MYKLWDCLGMDAKSCLFFYQRANYDKRWQPPREESGQDVTGHFSRNSENVPAIMEATPAEVKHGRGVFGERAQ